MFITKVKPSPAGLMSGWVTKNIYPFVKQKHWTENTINANKCELSKVQILLACFMQKQLDPPWGYTGLPVVRAAFQAIFFKLGFVADITRALIG